MCGFFSEILCVHVLFSWQKRWECRNLTSDAGNGTVMVSNNNIMFGVPAMLNRIYLQQVRHVSAYICCKKKELCSKKVDIIVTFVHYSLQLVKVCCLLLSSPNLSPFVAIKISGFLR